MSVQRALSASIPFVMDAISRITESFGVRIDATSSLVQAAIYGFLLVGIAAFGAHIVSTVRVLLSLFVLPGKPVSQLDWTNSAYHLTPPAHHIWTPRQLGSRHRRIRRRWEGVRSLACSQGLQPPPRLAYPVQTRHPHRRHLYQIWPQDLHQDAGHRLCTQQGRRLQQLEEACRRTRCQHPNKQCGTEPQYPCTFRRDTGARVEGHRHDQLHGYAPSHTARHPRDG